MEHVSDVSKSGHTFTEDLLEVSKQKKAKKCLLHPFFPLMESKRRQVGPVDFLVITA